MTAIEQSVIEQSVIEEREILDLLMHLVDKSLVVYEEHDGVGRYRLLDMTRQYAHDRLQECGEGAAWPLRHQEFFLNLAEEAEAGIKGADLKGWLVRLELEHDNLRAALDRSLRSEDEGETGLGLAGALWRFWETRGYVSEGRRWLGDALTSGRNASKAARAKVLNGAGALARLQGDFHTARALLEESLALRREMGDQKGAAASLNNLGNIAVDLGDYAAARALLEESLTIKRALGDQWGVALSLGNIARVAVEDGDNETAWTLNKQSLAIRRQLGDEQGIALALNNLGALAQAQSDFAAARAHYEESLAIRRRLGMTQSIAVTLHNLGNLAYDEGDLTRARAVHRESLAIRRELSDKSGIIESVRQLAAVSAAQGQPERGARLWGAVETLCHSLGSPLPADERERHDRAVDNARFLLGEAAFAAAWEKGRAMTMEQAINDALEEKVAAGA